MLTFPSLPIASPDAPQSHVPTLRVAQQLASGLLLLMTRRPADTLDATHAGAKGDRVCCPG